MLGLHEASSLHNSPRMIPVPVRRSRPPAGQAAIHPGTVLPLVLKGARITAWAPAGPRSQGQGGLCLGEIPEQAVKVQGKDGKDHGLWTHRDSRP